MPDQTTLIKELRDLVEKQANDEGLWFIAEHAPEAYLQQELRRLHAVVEAYIAAMESVHVKPAV